jgi:hypothetical protein
MADGERAVQGPGGVEQIVISQFSSVRLPWAAELLLSFRLLSCRLLTFQVTDQIDSALRQRLMGEIVVLGAQRLADAAHKLLRLPHSPPGSRRRQSDCRDGSEQRISQLSLCQSGHPYRCRRAGRNIWTAVPGSREGYYSGTSFAAPHVTAIVATIYDGGPRHSKDELLDRLQVRDLGTIGHDPIYGRGLLMAPASCRLDATTSVASQ